MFATHLHVLLDMDLQLPGVELMQMEVQPLGKGVSKQHYFAKH